MFLVFLRAKKKQNQLSVMHCKTFECDCILEIEVSQQCYKGKRVENRIVGYLDPQI